MFKKRLALATTIACVGAGMGIAFASASPAATVKTHHSTAPAATTKTFSGHLGPFGAETFHLNCADHGGYVRGKDPNKVSADFTGLFGQGYNLNVFPVVVADNTQEYAFLSRTVTSLTFRAQNIGPDKTKFHYEFSCVSDNREAWRVLG